MCLDKVTRRPKENNNIEGVGYVLMFNVNEGGDFEGLCDYGAPCSVNKEYMAKSENIGDYMSGFHIFKNKKDAKEYGFQFNYNYTVKVKYRDVICYGKQNDLRIVVARYRTIIKEVS